MMNRKHHRAVLLGIVLVVRSWADAAIETGADRIFWDEPHWANPLSFGAPAERCEPEQVWAVLTEALTGDRRGMET
jgi:hypothetical protein